MTPSEKELPEAKSPQIAFLLWGLGFVGICGVHRMYLEQYNLGSAMLATFGFLGVGQLVDVLSIAKEVEDHNRSNGILVERAEKKNARTSGSFEVKNTDSTIPDSSDEEDDLMKEATAIEETMKKLRERS